MTERSYPLLSYCLDQKRNLTHIINDVEDAFCSMQNGRAKEDWDASATVAFQRIRHNLLNSANNIERLPRSMRYRNVPVDSIPSADYVAGVINSMTSKN